VEALAAEQQRIGDENEPQSMLVDQKIYRLLEESIKAGIAEQVG
jgi:hypothetical protein